MHPVFTALQEQLRSGEDWHSVQSSSGKVSFVHLPQAASQLLGHPAAQRTFAVQLGIGDGLLASDGDLWQQQVRVARPFYNASLVSAFGEAATSLSVQRCSEWSGRTLDLGGELTLLTVSVAALALFGRPLGSRGPLLSHAVSEVVTGLGGLAAYLFGAPLLLDPGLAVRLRAARQQLNDFAETLLEQELVEPISPLLSGLLNWRHPDDGRPLERSLIRDEVTSLLISGHETTSLSLVWCLALLQQNPQVRAEVENELDEVLAGLPAGPADLERLPLLQRVFQETLRLYPPVWMLPRQLTQDVSWEERRLARGSVLVVSPYVIHRRPECWDDPERFDPSRFLPEAIRGRSPACYLPFGRGHHICLGARAATLEGVIVLANLLRRHRVDFARPPEPDCALTLRAQHTLIATVQPR